MRPPQPHTPHRARRAFSLARRHPVAAALLVALLTGAQMRPLAGCVSAEATGDPLLNVTSQDLVVTERIRAAETAWAEAQAGQRSRPVVRERFKDVIWAEDEPPRLRERLARLLLADETTDGLADSRRLVILRLPLEPDQRLAETLIRAAVDRGWTRATPALVRRLAEVPYPGDQAARPEPPAIRALNADRPFDRVLFETLLDPYVIPGQREDIRTLRCRRAALDVLGLIDPAGEALPRMALGASEITRGPDAVRIIRLLRRGHEELGVTPRTGRSFEWMARVLSDARAADTSWRRGVAAAIASLPEDRRTGLRLFHLEPIRWAADARPAWLTASRERLLETVASRLEGRAFNRRTAEIGIDRSGLDERFGDHRDAMSWADALALLAVDEALRSPSLMTRLFDLAELDRADTSTEYGGLLWAGPALDPAGARAQLFMPRTGDRISDTAFFASEDMIRSGDRALAHFHFQVADRRNADFAGPSGPDLAFARRSGRAGVVFTSLRGDRLAVDYYQPTGVIVDLGEIERP